MGTLLQFPKKPRRQTQIKFAKGLLPIVMVPDTSDYWHTQHADLQRWHELRSIARLTRKIR